MAPAFDAKCPSSVALPRVVTAQSEEGRSLFEAGFCHLLNFHHEAAATAFRRAVDCDESVAPIAKWGIATALGTHYNFPPGLGSGYEVICEALEAVTKGLVTELEADLIRATAARSSREAHLGVDASTGNFGNNETLNANYAEKMKELYLKYNKNMDVAYFYAEALMNLNPWKLWIKDGDDIRAADENTPKIQQVLEESLLECPSHPGLCHLYVHFMELSPNPEKALPEADVLRSAAKDCGHLVHMASHIDAWVGQYEKGLAANVLAVQADDKYVDETKIDSCFYKCYRTHNLHFAVWMAMFDGQSKVALAYAEKLERALPAGKEGVEFLFGGAVPLGAVHLESYAGFGYHVQIRFGMWQDILKKPLPKRDGTFACTLATARYARGIAFASLGRVEEALAEESKFLEALDHPAIEGRLLHNNVMWTKDDKVPSVFRVARAMLTGEIAYRQGDYDKAFQHLRDAVIQDDSLAYDEPWGWMVPARHALGALLLEQKLTQEAADVYRKDLNINKDNMWALFGLAKCLRAGAKPSPAETIAALDAKFKDASKRADITFQHTCFCAGMSS